MAARKKQTFSGQARSWAPLFLATFRNTLNVRVSAEAAGISRNTVYLALKDHAYFREEFEAAKADAVDMLAARALQKALAGESDVLTIYLLKVHGGPEYRNDQKRQQEHTLSPEQLRELVERICAAAGVDSDGILEEAEKLAQDAWSAPRR